jgi:transketolase
VTLLSTLLTRDLRHDVADPHWPDRDRLLLATPCPDAPQDAAALIGAPPGQAFAAAAGLAMAERLLAARFGRSLVDHRTWLQASHADLICGTGREAAHVAGALGLGRLAVLADLPREDAGLRASYIAAGWAVRTIDQGDWPGAQAALAACQRVHRPTLILAIGAEVQATPGESDHAPRGPAARRAWLKRLRRHASGEAFRHALARHMAVGWQRACQPEAPPPPGQNAAAAVTAALTRAAPILADLATLPLSEAPILPPPPIAAFPAGALAWDGLDLAAPGCLLGMALHGGILPLSQTASGVALPRAALAAAAGLGLRWLHTITQAGPAPPLPQLGIANVHVFEPADAAEALDCLLLALLRGEGPSVMALSQASEARVPQVATRHCARGAYLVHAPARRDVTLLAAGDGTGVAAAVREALSLQGVSAALVFMPCRALWDLQDAAYRGLVLGRAPLAAFAADELAFAGLVGAGDLILGMGDWPPDAGACVSAILRKIGGNVPIPPNPPSLI